MSVLQVDAAFPTRFTDFCQSGRCASAMLVDTCRSSVSSRRSMLMPPRNWRAAMYLPAQAA